MQQLAHREVFERVQSSSLYLVLPWRDLVTGSKEKSQEGFRDFGHKSVVWIV